MTKEKTAIVFVDLVSVMPTLLSSDEDFIVHMLKKMHEFGTRFNASKTVVSLITNETIIGNRKFGYDIERLFYSSIEILKSLSEICEVCIGKAFTKEFIIENDSISIDYSRITDKMSSYILECSKDSEVVAVMVNDNKARFYEKDLVYNTKKSLTLNISDFEDVPFVFWIPGYELKSGLLTCDDSDTFSICTEYKSFLGVIQALNFINYLKETSLKRAKNDISSALVTNNKVFCLSNNCNIEEIVLNAIVSPSKLDFVEDYECPDSSKRLTKSKFDMN